MTSRERLEAVFSGRAPDRAPFYPAIGARLACALAGEPLDTILSDPSWGSQLAYEAALVFGSDAVRVELSPPGIQPVGRHRIIETDDPLWGGPADLGGPPPVEVRHVTEARAWEDGGPIKAIQDIEQVRYPNVNELIEEGRLNVAWRISEQARLRHLFVIGNCEGRLVDQLARLLGGTDRLLALMVDDPHVAWLYFDKAAQACLEVICAYAWIGADAVCIGDRRVSGRNFSPWAFERFCAPAYGRMAEAARSLGMSVFLRCCQDVSPLLRKIKHIGVDGMEGMDPRTGVTVERARELFGDRLFLMGGVSRLTLRNGRPEQVREEASRCIAAGGKRFVLGAAGDVPFRTPRANLHALREAVEAS
jgi:uroporphyrinogen-III decarboxylase